MLCQEGGRGRDPPWALPLGFGLPAHLPIAVLASVPGALSRVNRLHCSSAALTLMVAGSGRFLETACGSVGFSRVWLPGKVAASMACMERHMLHSTRCCEAQNCLLGGSCPAMSCTFLSRGHLYPGTRALRGQHMWAGDTCTYPIPADTGVQENSEGGRA